MAAIYSNGGNRWNILGFNFTKRDALSSVYKISMVCIHSSIVKCLSWYIFSHFSTKMFNFYGRLAKTGEPLSYGFEFYSFS